MASYLASNHLAGFATEGRECRKYRHFQDRLQSGVGRCCREIMDEDATSAVAYPARMSRRPIGHGGAHLPRGGRRSTRAPSAASRLCVLRPHRCERHSADCHSRAASERTVPACQKARPNLIARLPNCCLYCASPSPYSISFTPCSGAWRMTSQSRSRPGERPCMLGS